MLRDQNSLPCSCSSISKCLFQALWSKLSSCGVTLRGVWPDIYWQWSPMSVFRSVDTLCGNYWAWCVVLHACAAAFPIDDAVCGSDRMRMGGPPFSNKDVLHDAGRRQRLLGGRWPFAAGALLLLLVAVMMMIGGKACVVGQADHDGCRGRCLVLGWLSGSIQ